MADCVDVSKDIFEVEHGKATQARAERSGRSRIPKADAEEPEWFFRVEEELI